MTEDFSAKLNQLLADPHMLAQIKALADTMTENSQKTETTAPIEPPPQASQKQNENISENALPLPVLFTPSPMLEKNLKHTRELLLALKPFLDDKRCEKIDKMLSMMRFAEMAGQFGKLF